jgi:hypothetical protein
MGTSFQSKGTGTGSAGVTEMGVDGVQLQTHFDLMTIPEIGIEILMFGL